LYKCDDDDDDDDGGGGDGIVVRCFNLWSSDSVSISTSSLFDGKLFINLLLSYFYRIAWNAGTV